MKRQRKHKRPRKRPHKRAPSRERKQRASSKAHEPNPTPSAESRRARAEALNDSIKSMLGVVNQIELHAMDALRVHPSLEDELGLSPGVAREYIRVATAFDDLPRLRALFSQGKMSWDQVRAITRVATPETELQWIATAANEDVDTLLKKVGKALRAGESGPG